ncbi:hypothetical protein THRCLA_11288 [Thraustotheca clavata]|uniref:Uncharacterized protein n=1 Tax=Thraustotheca clavata TaxID=74557 RepID=A0A1V9Y894_9STRA|nr:hypothetical protein THRCLA_11288 [Thraustotheca clavata]
MLKIPQTNSSLMPTISKKSAICGREEIFLASSVLLTTPGEIENTSAFNCWYTNHEYEWMLPDGTLLKISGRYFSSKALITASYPNQTDEIVIATLGKGLMVTIEAGVDAAAVLLLCRTWNHSQTDVRVSLLVTMYFFLTGILALAVHHTSPALPVLLLVSNICTFLGLILWILVFRG